MFRDFGIFILMLCVFISCSSEVKTPPSETEAEVPVNPPKPEMEAEVPVNPPKPETEAEVPVNPPKPKAEFEEFTRFEKYGGFEEYNNQFNFWVEFLKKNDTAILTYIKSVAHNPDRVSLIKTELLDFNDEKAGGIVKFRAENGFGALRITEKHFVINKEGEVKFVKELDALIVD